LYILTLKKGATRDAMQTANDLYESGLFRAAEPNLIHLVSNIYF